MRVLVVIPVYNRPDLIVRTLDSVAGQTRPPSAVVVVDDGSTDATAERVAAWIAAHPEPEVHLIRSANRGASAARNLGLARFGQDMEAVAFLDSDDRWPADFLARACQVMAQRPDAVAASTDREFVWANEDRRRYDDLAPITGNPWLWMLERDAGVGSCTLFRAAAVRAAGGYPEDIPTGHDAVLFGRIAALGPWLHLPGAPAEFLRSLRNAPAGHGGHLHHRYPDYLFRWAEVAQRVYREAPAGVHFGARGRRFLARRWRDAASNARLRGDRRQASHCIRHAIRLRPWSIRYWWLWLRIVLGTAG
ncbi:MAG: glycosyltransferase family 2 protein [Thiobacillus sp.]|nr:glycosyltransferase family 2 protein [Thiobacillus sp.]